MGGHYLRGVRKAAFLLVAFIVASEPVRAASVSIPFDSRGPSGGAPAADLLYQGQPLDRDEAVDLETSGVDLSTLDPVPNDVWGSGVPAHVDLHFPDDDDTVRFDSEMPSSQGLYRTRVVWDSRGVSRPFQLMMGLSAHASLARNALLRRLGYAVPPPRYYKKLVVKFRDFDARTTFLDSLSDGTLTARTRWIHKLPNDIPQVVLQDAVLETAQIDIPMYHWGVIPGSHLKGRRALRALILPLVLLEIPESINLYSFELGKVMNESVLLTYPYADSFVEATFPDLLWVARRIAALTRKDWEEIVRAGYYPYDVSALILEKAIARRNHMVDLLRLKNASIYPVNTKITIGNVKSGKLTAGNYDGYASRFSYGDPESPIRKSEAGRYLLIEGISGALGTLSSQVNQYLQVNSVDDVARQHQEDEFRNFVQWAQNNPGVPYARSLNVWGGPVGGFSVHASRNVVTGTYFGSEAKVQLVDNVGISASVGFFAQMSEVPIVIPRLFGNLSVQRNFLHLRAVTDMKTALKTDWTTVWVPHFINRLVGLIDDKKPGPDIPDVHDKNDPGYQRLLAELKPGEMLVVTDTLVASVDGRIDVPIPLLLNPALMQFNPMVGIGAGTSPTVLKRTNIMRTEDGIQIYIQNAKILDFELEFNFTWWLNILRLSHQSKHGIGETKAFLLDKLPETKDGNRQLVSALRAVIKSNDTELLEDEFKDYELHHDLKISIDRAKFLWWKGFRIEEDHHVRATPPGAPEAVRTLFSNRFVLNRGLAPYSFFSDIVSALTQNIVRLPNSTGLNAANSVLGSANWVSVTTEAEITPTYKQDPVCTVEHHWGGWFLSKSGLMKILDLIEAKVKPLNLNKALIRREEFNNSEMLQMYDILSALIVYDSGLDRLEATLMKPSVSTVISELIRLEGKEDLDAWCRNPDRSLGDKLFSINSYSDWESGHRVNYKCLKPWMKKALKIRNDVLTHKYPNTGEGHVKWKTRLVRKLEHHMDLSKLLKWVGKDNYFFQIKVSGFRTKDENGDMEYVSDSLGSFRSKEGAGAFRDFSLKYGITSSELYALYLAEGYSGGN